MIALYDSEGSTVTDALKQWRSRETLPTSMGSAELRNLSTEVMRRSVVSAATSSVEYLEEVSRVVDDMLSGKIDMATGRWELMKKLKQLGYDPTTGFPGDMGEIPPAKIASLRDLSSYKRLNLVLETNMRMAANYGLMIAGNTPYARQAYPAWELIRLYDRHIERGTEESHAAGWRERWEEAGSYVEWKGASQIRMVALKDSPIWLALGMGAGGDYTDTLRNPYPPFAFHSGMGWRAVPWSEALSLRLINRAKQEVEETRATLSPGQEEVRRVIAGLSPDLAAALERELAE
ncbi:MAG: hypothetical protein ABIT76_08640 [Chthoniobacterales bacterium]